MQSLKTSRGEAGREIIIEKPGVSFGEGKFHFDFPARKLTENFVAASWKDSRCGRWKGARVEHEPERIFSFQIET